MLQTAELAQWGVRPASSLTAAATGSAVDQALPVAGQLRGILPYGLVRGTNIAVDRGVGSTSLLFTLLAEASRQGSWCAVVGLPCLGLAAAAAAGIALDRLAVVADPGTELLPVAAAMLDGFDVVAVGPAQGRGYSQLAARARTTGSVLITMGPWTGAQLTLSPQGSTWSGRHRLRGRRLLVTGIGRGAASRRRRVELLMPHDPIGGEPTRETQGSRPRRHLRIAG